MAMKCLVGSKVLTIGAIVGIMAGCGGGSSDPPSSAPFIQPTTVGTSVNLSKFKDLFYARTSVNSTSNLSGTDEKRNIVSGQYFMSASTGWSSTSGGTTYQENKSDRYFYSNGNTLFETTSYYTTDSKSQFLSVYPGGPYSVSLSLNEIPDVVKVGDRGTSATGQGSINWVISPDVNGSARVVISSDIPASPLAYVETDSFLIGPDGKMDGVDISIMSNGHTYSLHGGPFNF